MVKNVNGIKIITVAGMQRSGTTLVGQILGVHSKSFLIDESDDAFHPVCQWLLSGYKTRFPESKLPQAAKKYKDSRSDVSSISQLNEFYLVIKAPNLSFEYSRLSGLSNSQKLIVYPVRDARSVVATMLRRKKSNMIEKQINWFLKHPYFQKQHQEMLEILVDDKTPEHIKAALIWNHKTQLYKKFQANKMNPLVIRYEDVVSQTRDNCLKLVEYCGLNYEDSMQEHHLLLSGKAPGNTVRERQIDQDSLNKWQAELSVQQIDQINQICELAMNELGYQL